MKLPDLRTDRAAHWCNITAGMPRTGGARNLAVSKDSLFGTQIDGRNFWRFIHPFSHPLALGFHHVVFVSSKTNSVPATSEPLSVICEFHNFRSRRRRR